MNEMIVIRPLKNGYWVIGVIVRKCRNELIERGKICRI